MPDLSAERVAEIRAMCNDSSPHLFREELAALCDALTAAETEAEYQHDRFRGRGVEIDLLEIQLGEAELAREQARSAAIRTCGVALDHFADVLGAFKDRPRDKEIARRCAELVRAIKPEEVDETQTSPPAPVSAECDHDYRAIDGHEPAFCNRCGEERTPPAPGTESANG